MRDLGRGIGFCSALLLLSACGTQHPRRAARPVAVNYPVVQPVRPQVSRPYHAATSAGSEAVLRLRAGLNVAALSCRGRGMPAVTPAYGQMLGRHRAMFASAYRTETQRLGQSGLDRQQTRIYNRFANQQSPASFCRSAAFLAGQASNMESPRLASASPQMVAELESQLR